MFLHNFKYTIKTLFKNKMLIFWTFAFPIILGTLFKMAFSNIEKSEKLDVIDIAIVNNDDFNNNLILKETFKFLSEENNENRLFNTKYVTVDEANNLLQENEVCGYLIIENNNPKVVVLSSGINETIFKFVIEEIMQSSTIVSKISEGKIEEEIKSGNYNIDYSQIYKEAVELVQEKQSNINDISNSNLSYTMIEFYTLIAMTCLYSGIIGMTSINKCLPNMSNNGKRISISPINKIKIIFSSVLASYIVSLIGLALLFVYTIFVLNINYGDNLLLVIILGMAGSLAGLSIGVAVGSCLKSNENTKVGIIISITMLGCFLSGMMGITMKYIVDKNIPVINKINPASMITDGFYSLYYYETLDRYFFNLVSLLIFSGIMVLLSYIGLRRQKYDSI